MSKTRTENLALIRDNLALLLDSDEHGLRDRQHQALFKLAASDGDQLYQGYFNQTTGAGKTVQMATLIKAFRSANPGQKVIILEKFVKMVEQVTDAFTDPKKPEYLEEAPDVIGQCHNNRKDIDKPIIVATYASLKNLVKDLDVGEVGLVLPDEAHNCLSELRSENLKVFRNACIYGFTATPTYDEKKSIQNLLENELDEMSIEEGIKQGLNCSVKNILLISDVAVDLSQVKRTAQGEYDNAEFDKAVGESQKEVKHRIVEFWENFSDEDTGEKASDRLTMVNCRSLDEARVQAEAFNAHFGKTVAKAYGSDLTHEERVDVLRGFENGEFPVICQVGTLGEGYNHPALSLCINYATSSRVRETQRSGRVLRIDPNDRNKKAWVVDIVFRHPDYLDAPITVAAKANNQVLFGHIMGRLEIISPKRQEFDDKAMMAKRRGPWGNPLGLPGFTVKYTIQELFDIDSAERAWKESKRYLLGTYELQELYYCTYPVICQKLQKLYDGGVTVEDKDGNKIPLVVYTLKSRGKPTYYLNVQADSNTNMSVFDMFEEETGLLPREHVISKTDSMLTPHGLAKILNPKSQELKDLLENACMAGLILKDAAGRPVLDDKGDEIPLALAVVTHGYKEKFVLNGVGDEAIDKQICDSFAKIYGLERYVGNPAKTGNMLGPGDLTRIFKGKQLDLRDCLSLSHYRKDILINSNGIPVLDDEGNKIPIALRAVSEGSLRFFLNGTENGVINKMIFDRFAMNHWLSYRDKSKYGI